MRLSRLCSILIFSLFIALLCFTTNGFAMTNEEGATLQPGDVVHFTIAVNNKVWADDEGVVTINSPPINSATLVTKSNQMFPNLSYCWFTVIKSRAAIADSQLLLENERLIAENAQLKLKLSQVMTDLRLIVDKYK